MAGLVRDRPELVTIGDFKAPPRKHVSQSMGRTGNVRQQVTRTMMAKVQAKEENWAYNIHNLIFMIRNDGLVTSDEAQVLMQACQRDILDLMPAAGQILTELAWETVSADSTTITGIQLPSLYANMLDAFTFQKIEADVNLVHEAMSKHCSETAYGTKMALVKHLCWRGKVEEAWELQSGGKGMAWSENLASHFVQGYAGLGRMDAAEDVLQMLNDKNIHWGNMCYEAMVLGCARAGDMDRVEFFLDRLKELQVPYAPRRWVLSLANCLVKLEDVKSFVDILEVAYNNSAKRGNWDDLEVVTESLLHFTVRGSRQAGNASDGSSHALRAHQVLVWVLDEVWKRRLRLPARQLEKVACKVHSQGGKGLAEAIRNVPRIEHEEPSRRRR